MAIRRLVDSLLHLVIEMPALLIRERRVVPADRTHRDLPRRSQRRSRGKKTRLSSQRVRKALTSCFIALSPEVMSGSSSPPVSARFSITRVRKPSELSANRLAARPRHSELRLLCFIYRDVIADFHSNFLGEYCNASSNLFIQPEATADSRGPSPSIVVTYRRNFL